MCPRAMSPHRSRRTRHAPLVHPKATSPRPNLSGMAPTDAHLMYERTLVNPGEFIIGVDEVGRGALAGPVCVGAVLLDAHAADDVPTGLTDSKLVSAANRAQLVPQIHSWCTAAAVGFASAAERVLTSFRPRSSARSS
ncbi:MAG: hypothetical protein EBU85_06885 [Actinobacteria bacterium]|nr:hypothetical protein [Actinomycetota bacterium]